MAMPSDLEIARQAHLKPIARDREDMGIEPRLLEHYGESVAKIKLEAIAELADRPEGQVRGRLCDHPDAARRGQDDDCRRSRPGDAAHRQEGDDLDPPSRPWARPSASREAPPAAATARPSRWSRSTFT